MKTTTLRAVGTCAALALTASACGSGSGGASDANDPVNVGTIPNPSVAAVYLGIEQGMFEDAGVTVKPKIATGFAPNLAAVVNGESEVGFAAVVPLMVARAKGAPIKIIAGTDAAPKKYDAKTDPDNIFTSPDSGIDGPADLEGKTVAVTALGSIQELGVSLMVEDAGGDPKKVKFLALPSNDMLSALEQGRVDAVALSEPFNSEAHAQGLKPLFSYVTSPTPGAPVGAYFTSENTLKTKADSINAFVKGVEEATTYAQDNPDAVRTILPTYTKISADVAGEVNTFDYASKITPEQIDQLSTILVEQGYMDSEVTAEDILK